MWAERAGSAKGVLASPAFRPQAIWGSRINPQTDLMRLAAMQDAKTSIPNYSSKRP
jgi:hypothetical protein